MTRVSGDCSGSSAQGAGAGLAEVGEGGFHRLHLGGDHFGPRLVGVLLKGLVAVAAYYRDDGVVGAELALVGERHRRGDGGAAGGLGGGSAGGAREVAWRAEAAG